MDKPKHTIPFYNMGQRLARIAVCQQQVLRLSSLLVLLGCALLGVIGCSNDELPETEQPDASPQPITIRLDVAALPSLNAHNSRSWQYAEGNVPGENIQSAFTLMFDDKFRIERILVLRGEGNDLKTVGMVDEKNPAAKDGLFRTTTGEKSFLTFVNIPREVVEAAYAKKLNSTNPNLNFKFKVGESFASDEARTALSEMSIAVCASKFNETPPSSTTGGIPMTGWHKAMLTYRTHNLRTFTVYALRMLSKLQFDFTNELGQKVKINSIEVDRLTDDATATNGNVKPFPHPATPLGPTDLTVTVKPSLLATATQSPKTFTVDSEIESGQKVSCSFYVNETDVPNNVFHQFTLKLNLTLADGTTQQVRYALVSNEANEWNYIARNDWRIIPIVLQDYKLELVPQDFPPIGVLPAAVKSENDVFTCIFHASGDFHLKPQLVQYSTGKVVQTWEQSEPLFETLTPNDALYNEKPEWSALDGCIHGSFASDQTGQSVHTLTLKCKPEGGVERLYVVPVIIDKQE